MDASTRELHQNLIHRFNISDALRRTACREPKRGIKSGDRLFTYPELDAIVESHRPPFPVARHRRGDTVGIFALNSIEFIAALYACGRIGAALVPVNLLFTPEEADYVLEKTQIKALLVDPVFVTKVKRAWANQFTIDEEYRALVQTFDGSPVETVRRQ